MFADLRRSVRIPVEHLQAAGRVGAMSLDARVAVLRRDAYFRYRWPLSLDDVLNLERFRGLAQLPAVSGGRIAFPRGL